MTCDETAEFVSALCDGEAIPRTAAEHVSTCAACQARLREYTEMGAELRLVASLAIKKEVAPRVWNSPRNTIAMWWQKGWETMRIPRFAFAVLIATIVGLGSTFAVVQVRAHSNGTVVLLKIASPDGGVNNCALNTQDKMWARCSLLGQMNGKTVSYGIDLIGRKDDGVELGVRTKMYGPSSGTYDMGGLQKEPQKQVYFEPGQTMKLDVPGAGAFTVTGEWLDHMPLFLGVSTQDVQVGPEELRLISPVLISGKQVLGDFPGGSGIVDKAGSGVEIYMPGEGRFIFSLSPMRGAVQAHVELNRISFEDGGRSYVFVTGSPVSRDEHIWVVHEAKLKPDDWENEFIKPDGLAEHEFVSSGDLHKLAPGLVIDGETTKN